VAEEERAAGLATGEAGAEDRVGALEVRMSFGWYSSSASWMIEIAPVACESAVWTAASVGPRIGRS
jgi:hypothetical protein